MAAIKPHKVPESVFDVEFKLFDFMTMKQFVIIMITAVFATMFYFLLDKLASGFLKWLVVSIIVMIGLIIAFVKVQGEPFEVYVSNFILALVSPQRRVWKKQTTIPRYLRDNSGALATQKKLEKQLHRPAPPVSKETITREIQKEAEPTKFDLIEEQYLKGEIPQFGAVYKAEEQPQATTAPPPPPFSATQPPGVIWGTVNDQNNLPLPGVTVQIRDENHVPVASIQTNQTGQFRTGGILAEGIYTIVITHPTLKFLESEVGVGKNPLEPLVITPTTESQVASADQPDQVKPLGNLPDAESIAASTNGQPNILQGEIVDQSGNPLTSVTITVKGEEGSVVRSLTTNALGQFFSSSQLQNGEYVVELERQGYNFEKYVLSCSGQLLRPKRIVGKLSGIY